MDEEARPSTLKAKLKSKVVWEEGAYAILWVH
jgi:hypothetical protein